MESKSTCAIIITLFGLLTVLKKLQRVSFARERQRKPQQYIKRPHHDVGRSAETCQHIGLAIRKLRDEIINQEIIVGGERKLQDTMSGDSVSGAGLQFSRRVMRPPTPYFPC